MAQLHFILDSDFFVGLFSETKDEAFGKLMEALLNQVLQAESTEQLGANNYERSQKRSGSSVIIGFQKTQIYQRFAGSRQEVFILKD